jgi:hypothetical protein
MDIVYVRYQDDILALCKSKRQLNRCRKRMMEVLGERQLKLSRKKSRMGTVTDSFHYFVQWALWWVKTANIWDFQSLEEQFIMTCWQDAPANIAAAVLSTHITELDCSSDGCGSTLAA